MRIVNWVVEPQLMGRVQIEEIVHNHMKDADLDTEQRVLMNSLKDLMIWMLPLELHSGPIPGMYQMMGNLELMLSILALIEKQYPQLWEPKYRETLNELYAESNLTQRLKGLIGILQEVQIKLQIIRANARLLSGEDAHQRVIQSMRVSGESPGGEEPQNEIAKYKQRLEGKKLPAQAKARIEEELNRFARGHANQAEAPMMRTYLDILTSYPWGITTPDSLDIDNARSVLNDTHYGMDDVKQRILEILAVGKLKGKIQGKIMCFLGPPGVGKTSIGEGIGK